MLESNRDLYMEFANAHNLNLPLLTRIVEGDEDASDGQARWLASVTGTKPRLWAPGGEAKTRLVALKVWHLKQGRPAVNVNEAWPSPPKTRCPNCD